LIREYSLAVFEKEFREAKDSFTSFLLNYSVKKLTKVITANKSKRYKGFILFI